MRQDLAQSPHGDCDVSFTKILSDLFIVLRAHVIFFMIASLGRLFRLLTER
jgi:hypothetical protein